MNLACWITATRFILAPLIFWQLTTKTETGAALGIVLLLLAGFSDVLDGWVARARQEITELGKALDPFGDKLVIFFTLWGLTRWGLPGWLVIIYLLKEGLQVIAGIFLFKKIHQIVPANYWGKSSTVTFFLGFGLFLINRLIGLILIGTAVILSIYALYTYYKAYQRIKKQLR